MESRRVNLVRGFFPVNLRQKLDARLDELQEIMENDLHLMYPDKAMDLTYRISPFWTVLSEEDREYVQCAQDAIEEGWKWGDPNK